MANPISDSPTPNNPMSKKTLYVIIAVVAVLAIGGIVSSFLLKKGAEKVSEKIIEDSIGGGADVDLSNGSYSVNVNGGSFQVGDDVEIPESFPEDIYVISGDVKYALATTETSGYTVTIETTKTPAEVNTIYNREVAADGWSISGTSNYGGTYSIMGQKGDRYLSVTASETDGQTTVMLTTYTSS